MTVDVHELSAALADGLRCETVELTRIDVMCAWPVFKATYARGETMFVKVTTVDAARRTLAFLSSVADVPFLAKPVLLNPIPFNGMAVVCLEWKVSTRVNAEDMTEGQLGSFLDACCRLSEALAKYRGEVAPVKDEDSPRGRYDLLQRYVLRHSLVGRLLRPILQIPESERSYEGHPLVTIHGDFQPKNYGFDGDRIAAVYDTDDLTKGLACEDAAYAFTERVRRSGLSVAARRRLTDLFLRMVEMSPWSKDEWLVAVNHSRLRIAARRLEKRPDSCFVAFDIARRDKSLDALVRALKGATC